jgi:hypothetical protein
MGYKLLGFIVWRAGKWYLGRRLASLSATRKVALAGGLTAAAAALLLLAGGSARKVRPAGQLRS